ncbi:hypothetical protein EDB85DRAFT_1899423 [Lactarius pseudohatsudake]|nr:hypothetical protein EDB85DRAFT_1899423 [Lactarius pseudohatsudake]
MKKDKGLMNHWSEADKATLVHTLASEKAKSNWGDNGPKKVAWTVCEVALLDSEKTSGGTPKTFQSIKNQWQRVGVDVSPESHKKARPFRNKKWCALYNNIMELVDGTQATGANAVQFGQTPRSSRAQGPSVPIDPVLLDQSKGKNGSDVEVPVGAPLSQCSVTDVLTPNQAFTPGPAEKEPRASFFEGDKYDTSEDDALVKMPVSPEPPKRKHSKSTDPKAKDKRQRVTAGEGMSSISSSMRDVADSVHTAVVVKLNTPQVFAIKAIEKDGGLTHSEFASTVECMMGDAEFANMYLAVVDASVHVLILRRKIDSHVL